MSTVSGISSSSALSWLKNLSRTSSTTSTASTSSTDSTRQPGGDFQSKIDSALSDQGITGTKLSDLRSQIEAAVKQAKSSGDGSTGGRDAVKSAVDGVLKNAGVDVDKFDSEIKPKGGPHGARGHHGKGGPPPTDASSTDGTDDSTATTGTTASSFDAYLKQSGIDPDAFKSSILATFQGGGTDFSGAFSGASVGSSVDLVA